LRTVYNSGDNKNNPFVNKQLNKYVRYCLCNKQFTERQTDNAYTLSLTVPLMAYPPNDVTGVIRY
jgi:hypothetical protein